MTKYFNIKSCLFLVAFFLFSNSIHSQNTKSYAHEIKWHIDSQGNLSSYTFDSGIYNDEVPQIELYYQSQQIARTSVVDSKFRVSSAQIIILPDSIAKKIQNTEFRFSIDITEIKGSYFQNTVVFPMRRNLNGQIEKLLSFSVEVYYDFDKFNGLRNPEATFTSALSIGDIYKISVDKSGIFKIDKNFLETKLGIDVSKISPKKIKIYGNRGGRVAEANSKARIDDIQELKIFVNGESDGKFDAGDYILFYAEGADLWSYNEQTNQFDFDKNIYDNNNFYFIKIDNQDGLRISKKAQITDIPDFETSYYDKTMRLEEDKVNLLGSFSGTEGTGKDWYGELFKSNREKTYTSLFDIKNYDVSKPIEVSMAFAARSRINSTLNLIIGSKTISKNISSVNTLNAESLYARRITFKESVTSSEPNPIVKLSYPNISAESELWLDYLQIVFSQELFLNNTQLPFRNKFTKNSSVAKMNFKDFVGQVIWDITNPLEPEEITVSDQSISFKPLSNVREFISHNNLSGAFEPVALGKIKNQNLHQIQNEDMILVYHPLFKNDALRLAEHRSQTSNLKVIAAQTDEIYNEFSGGKVDPGAIRDMARLLLQRNPDFKYLLLFGDGSYDYKTLVKEITAENFIPVYETDESLDPIEGFPSDDFYALLGDNEGEDLKGSLDVFVGRLPAKTADEARVLVDKIIHYDTSPKTLGDWRLRAGYVADDEDGNTHLRDMDDIARADEIRHPLYNQQKVYLDAFKQISTPGESRYPEANKSLNDNMFKGQLSLTYLGHGGPLGWAQERILTVPEIQAWSNYDQMTVMVTATCSFAAYDDPAVVSPAEYAILNPKGGVIALLSTTRAVYTSSNKLLTDASHENMFKKINGVAPTLGYVLATGKNKYQGDFFRVNSRKFTLIGDPSMPIAMPKYNVYTTTVNDKDVKTQTDTISALEKVTIKGYIGDLNGSKLSSFNGTIFPTVYDKKSTFQTLGNDSGSPKFTFTMFKNILFKGSASVINGEWTFSFWVPKNINYSYGYGRISYYASDEKSIDAGGVFNNIVIGGTNQNHIADNEGPELDIFMNDESFVFGGLTNADPVLLLNLRDDLGINVTGNAVGQDITAILDDNDQNVYILNDFYESKKDDFTSGKVRFPLTKLNKGSHHLVAKAWDISGNSAEKRTEFFVAENGDDVLKHVLNYPNPFTTHTLFQFEHDLPNTEIDVIVNIYTITGKLVKSIAQTKYSSGFRVNDIGWNGRDDFDSSLAKGLYLYKVRVKSKELNLTRESGFEKLIIL